jgi:hypothetical protein
MKAFDQIKAYLAAAPHPLSPWAQALLANNDYRDTDKTLLLVLLSRVHSAWSAGRCRAARSCSKCSAKAIRRAIRGTRGTSSAQILAS